MQFISLSYLDRFRYAKRANLTVNKSENTDNVFIAKLKKFDNYSGVAIVDIYSKNGMCYSLFLLQLILLKGYLTME